MRRFVLLVFLSQLTAPAQAQSSKTLGRPAIPTDSVPTSIQEAEARGERSPRVERNNVDTLSQDVGGTNQRRCVDVNGINIVRSGDFIAGPFASYSEEWRGGYGKIWWKPSFVGEPHATLSVTAARLDTIAVGRVFEQSDLAYPTDEWRKRVGAQFYPSGFRVPSTGRWLLVASAGGNWGCFILTVR
jgi:hypothetical protein